MKCWARSWRTRCNHSWRCITLVPQVDWAHCRTLLHKLSQAIGKATWNNKKINEKKGERMMQRPNIQKSLLPVHNGEHQPEHVTHAPRPHETPRPANPVRPVHHFHHPFVQPVLPPNSVRRIYLFPAFPPTDHSSCPKPDPRGNRPMYLYSNVGGWSPVEVGWWELRGWRMRVGEKDE